MRFCVQGSTFRVCAHPPALFCIKDQLEGPDVCLKSCGQTFLLSQCCQDFAQVIFPQRSQLAVEILKRSMRFSIRRQFVCWLTRTKKVPAMNSGCQRPVKIPKLFSQFSTPKVNVTEKSKVQPGIRFLNRMAILAILLYINPEISRNVKHDRHTSDGKVPRDVRALAALVLLVLEVLNAPSIGKLLISCLYQWDSSADPGLL